jgi:hypothetical protein
LGAVFQTSDEGVVKSRRHLVKAKILQQRGEVDFGSTLEYRLLDLQVFEEAIPWGQEE